MSVVAGVDGCRVGWVAAAHDLGRGECAITVHATFAALLVAFGAGAPGASGEPGASGARVPPRGRVRVVAVDIPIGLSDAAPRAVDVEARRFLRKRGSSVFPAPCRAALAGRDYAEASARSFAVSGRKLSRQTYGILAKIREVDETLRHRESGGESGGGEFGRGGPMPAGTAEAAPAVVEVHPEVSFAVRNGGRPMTHSKKRAEGAAERLALLDAPLRAAFGPARATWLRRDVASDDLLDALIAAWTARRILEGVARTFPAGPLAHDATGLPMRIVA